MTITLRASSYEGFGGREYFEQEYKVGSLGDIEFCLRHFSLSYGVGLSDIQYSVKGEN